MYLQCGKPPRPFQMIGLLLFFSVFFLCVLLIKLWIFREFHFQSPWNFSYFFLIGSLHFSCDFFSFVHMFTSCLSRLFIFHRVHSCIFLLIDYIRVYFFCYWNIKYHTTFSTMKTANNHLKSQCPELTCFEI